MKLWQRALGTTATASRSSFDDFFSFGGFQYPSLNTTMKGSSEEAPASNFQSYVDWAYKGSGPVFAATAARMRIFSEAKFLWRERRDDGRDGQMFDSPELDVLRRPWPGGTTGDLLARMEQHGSLAGQAFVRRIRTRGGPDRLSILRPDWVTIVLGSQENVEHPDEAADTTVVGYQYTPKGVGRSTFFIPEEVAHYAPTPDPSANFRGLSWLTPVIREIQGDKSATRHKVQFYDNAATPNMALKFETGVTREQIEGFKELFEAEHQGIANAYKTLFLGGGADVTAIGQDFKQMDFRNVQGLGETRIFEAAETHPVIVGSAEGMQGSSLNSGNFAQIRRRFADGTMKPLWRNVASSLEVLFTAPEQSYLTVDLRDVAFLRADAKEEAETFGKRATAIRTLTDGGFTPESVIAAVDNLDLTQLEHTGLLPVQQQKPGEGEEDD